MDANRLCAAAQTYVQSCFVRETAPRASELARLLGMTPSQLTRLFRAMLGVAPSTFLKDARLREAQRLLVATDRPLNAIAYRCGFGTRVTFYRGFRKAIGITPAGYRRTYR